MTSNAIKKVNEKNRCFLFISYILSIIIVIIVYYTGGTINAYSNFMYIPIAITASTNGIKHSLIHAGLCGLALGYYMPLEVASNTRQLPINWIIRIIIYLLIAVVIGCLSDYSKKSLKVIYQKEDDIINAQLATIYSLAKISEARDADTGKHVQRVVVFSKLLANKLQNIDKFKDCIDARFIDNIVRGHFYLQ